MIQVALGTENFQFTRPLKWLDKAINDGIINEDEEIRVQAGPTKYKPRHKNFVIYDFIDFNKLQEGLSNARIGIIHAGMGNVLDFVEIGRMPIIIPRDPTQGEHLDGHQLDFAKVASKEMNIPFIYTYTEFVKALKEYDGKAEFPTFRRELIEFLVGVVEEKE